MLPSIVKDKPPIEDPETAVKIRSIRLDLDAYKILERDAKRCKRSVNGQLEAIIFAYYGIDNVELDYSRIEKARNQVSPAYKKPPDNQPENQTAKIADKKATSNYTLLPGKTYIMDVAETIRRKTGMSKEEFKIDYLADYHTNKEAYEKLPQRVKGLIEAYYQGKLDDYISASEAQAPDNEAGYGS